MTLRTITFDDSIYKLVPLEPTIEWQANLADIQDCVSYETIRNVIAAAPEYQDKYSTGFCNRSEGCVCGGDLPRVRESCSSWVKPISRHQEG